MSIPSEIDEASLHAAWQKQYVLPIEAGANDDLEALIAQVKPHGEMVVSVTSNANVVLSGSRWSSTPSSPLAASPSPRGSP